MPILPREGIDLGREMRRRATRLDDIITEAIYAALDACDGRVLDAAHELGVSRSTVYRYLERARARIQGGRPPCPMCHRPFAPEDEQPVIPRP
jgi:hypothetical protein